MSRKEGRKARRERRRELRRGALRQKMRTEPGAFWTYVVLRTIVILILIRSVMRADFESAIVCAFVLFIYVLPQFVEDIEIPSVLEIVIFVFVFAAEILGELDSYFIRYQHWDTMLHTTNGFLCAAVGFSLIDILNRKVTISQSRQYVSNAIKIYCKSVFRALEENDMEELRFYSDEL